MSSAQRGGSSKPLLSFSDKEEVDVSSYNFSPDGRVRVKSPAKGWIISTVVCAIIAVLALGLAAGLGVGLGFSIYNNYSTAANGNSSNGSADGVCTSHACVKLSSQIISFMDASIDPCQDFYQFACNGYLKDAIIPDDEEVSGTFDILTHEDIERIRSLMTSGNNMSLGAIEKAITFYNSCVDTSTIEKQSLPSLHQLLTNLGGWPLVGIDLGTQWSINDVQGYVSEQLYGSTAFFVLQVLPDDQNSTQNIINIESSGLTLNSALVYQTNDTRDLVKNLIVSVLQLVNSSIPTQQYEDAAQEILEFETKISEIINFTHSAILTPLRRNITSFDYMSKIFPSFNWMDNMEYYVSQGGFNFDRISPVYLLAQSQFFIDLSSLINSTDSRILQNYAKWQLVYRLLPDLSSPFIDLYNSLQQQLGALPSSLRYKVCVRKVESTFKHAVARAFHDVYVLPGTFSNLTVVTMELKAALEQRINSKDWLDSTTKQRALDKAKAIIEQLVYPQRIANNSFLEILYSSYEVSLSSGYFMNAVNSMRSARLEELGRITKINDRAHWILSMYPPTIVNAAYSPFHNQIYIFEGILNIPFFKPYWPTYYQFGSIGFVVGHEYTHGFDNTGQLFDEHGNFVNWWTPKSLDEFKKRTDCFVNQYSKYSLDAGKVNGSLTLGENIADNGGLPTAFLAYKNRVKKTGEVQQKLPGLPYNPDQLFFIGATQIWCTKATIKGQKVQLKGVHSPAQLRPKGFLTNSPDFSAAFNCPVGSPMNPKDKCELW